MMTPPTPLQAEDGSNNSDRNCNDKNPVGSLVSRTLLSEKHAGQRDNDEDVLTGGGGGPRATTFEVLQCQFSSWYPTFSNLQGNDVKRKNVTIRSIIIQDLPPDFEDYLLSDYVFPPLHATTLSSFAANEGGGNNHGWSSDDDDDEEEIDNASSRETDNDIPQFYFPELNEKITQGIASLQGAVLPKLNWSSPKDAKWIHGMSLKCETAGDVYVLLKSSDFCLHDVLRESWKDSRKEVPKGNDDDDDYDADDAAVGDSDPQFPPLELILRKWCNLHPSMEFRCFIRQHEFVAISQRHHSQHYSHLRQDLPRIRHQLVLFFETTIRHVFAQGQVANYVVDLYLDQQNRVWILDFNLWAQSTDSLLYEWSELLTLDVEEDPQFRLVEAEHQVRQDPLASYRAPIDTINLASMTAGDASQFEKFMKQCQKPSEREVDDGSDET